MLGFTEIAVVLAAIIVVWNIRRLPEIGGSIRKSLLGFRAGLKGEDEKRKIRDVKPVDPDDEKPS